MKNNCVDNWESANKILKRLEDSSNLESIDIEDKRSF